MELDSNSCENYAARVLIPGLPDELYYSLEDSSTAGVGSQVEVELGRSTRQGWIVGIESLEKVEAELAAKVRSPESRSKQLSLIAGDSKSLLKKVKNAVPAFSNDLLEVFEWMAAYYGVPLPDVIENAIPRIATGRKVLYAKLSESGARLLATPEEREALERRAPAQARLLTALQEHPEHVSLTDLQHVGKSLSQTARTLEKRGLVSLEYREKNVIVQQTALGEAAPVLGEDQGKCVDAISAALKTGAFSPMLLFGVTGSGKTEVYLRAIRETLAAGKSALVIVPEIALTPQLLDRFTSRISEPIAVLHSQVGQSERWAAWTGLLQGNIRVAVGARSAIFAPVQNLGLVVVDEEHESSYKQSDGIRYSARDVAVIRAKIAKCPVVLGSATPSFESLLNAKRGKYHLLELPSRVSARPLPQINIVDLRTFKRKEMPSENISPPLHEAMASTLEQGKQIVILYNRRGFSSYLQCDSCGEVVSCPHCSVAMTFHKKRNLLLCHYCDFRQDIPSACTFCRNDKTSRPDDEQEISVGLLHHRGGGTERMVEEIHSLFPDARIARMDRDTVGAKDSYRNILESMRDGTSDILIGTQMIAKGHDLPGVTLVGIIDADIGLNLPDFRASEKTFQLVTQAAGRAGRGEDPGEVVIQTRQPNHPTIVATVTGRFLAFARYELDQRQGLDYPPWGRLLRIVVSSEDIDDALRAARQTATAVEEFVSAHCDDSTQVSMLGPATAPLERLRGRYRWHIIIKSDSQRFISMIAGSMNRWRHALPKNVRVTVDVDPSDML